MAQYTITLTDLEETCLAHDLLDIQQWLEGAIRGKVSKCKGRLIEQNLPKLLADPAVTTMPATEDELVTFITERDVYLNRTERDALEASLVK